MRSDGRASSLPFVSVIMPVRNEERFIERSLGAVLEQDYPADRFEILIVDGMSDDKTRSIVSGMARGRKLRILDNEGRTAPRGLNVGIRQAQGEIVVRVDGHTVIATDYIRRSVEALERTGADCVGGGMRAVSDSPFGRAVAAATSHPFGLGGSRFHFSEKEEEAESVYLGIYRKSVFERVGYFDEELTRNQDDEFNYRLRSRGGKVVLVPGIRSEYFNRTSPGSLWRQYFQYGFWKIRVIQKVPDQVRIRHLVPATFVASLILTSSLSLIWPELIIALTSIVVLYLVFVSLVAISAVGMRSLRLAPATLLALGLIHVGYGTGFLAGSIRFAGRWRSVERPELRG